MWLKLNDLIRRNEIDLINYSSAVHYAVVIDELCGY